MKRESVCVFLVTCSVYGLSAFADPVATFQGLGHPPAGGVTSQGHAVSGDGAVAAGYYTGPTTGDESFTWTLGTGMQSIGGHSSNVNALSYDGSVAVGYTNGGNAAALWTQAGGMQTIGSGPGQLYDLSYDGSMAVGQSGGGRGLIWDSGTVTYVAHPTAGHVGFSGVSADGSTLAGTMRTGLGGSEAFTWTSGGGFNMLPSLPNIQTQSVMGISGDGTTVVGIGSYGGLDREAFRWTEETGITGLGRGMLALGVSEDGSVIVGLDGLGANQEAAIWDSVHGVRSLKQVLAYDLDMTGWHLNVASAVSADGLSIVGTGFNPRGDTEAWLATLPEPDTIPAPGAILLGTIGMGLVGWMRRRL